MSVNPDDRPWPRTIEHEGLDWPEDEQRILVPFHEAVNRRDASLLGASVTFGTDGELYVLHTVEGERGESPDAVREESGLQLDVEAEFSVPVTQEERAFSPGVLSSFVGTYSITATVVDRAESRFFSRGRDEKSVVDGCHTVVGTRMDEFDAPASILVPVAKGPHSGLASRIAEAVARAYGSWMELFHVVPADASSERVADARDLLEAYEYRLGDDVAVDRHVSRAADSAREIVDHADYHDLTVLGAPEKGRLRRFLFGSTTDAVTDGADATPVLTAHRRGTESVLSRWF